MRWGQGPFPFKQRGYPGGCEGSPIQPAHRRHHPQVIPSRSSRANPPVTRMDTWETVVGAHSEAMAHQAGVAAHNVEEGHVYGWS